MRKRPIIFIIGPTAVGKTRLAIKLAKRINGEIISCDSMQAYRGMRILSQAPAISEREYIKHHLVGSLNTQKEYSAALFIKKAARLIAGIIYAEKMPIVVGGSGLYIKVLIDGLFPSPKADLKFRKTMQAFVTRHGTDRLHEKLSKIDPDAAYKIHPNDARRIIRALEIYNTTGRTMTELKKETMGLKDFYKIKIFGLTMPRVEIYSSIDRRVEEMFGKGLLKEVKMLKKKALSKTAREALGLKEVSDYLDGKYDLDAAKELLKRNTRRFAKRQLTWFRPDKRIRWFDLTKLNESDIVKNIIREIS